jgi:hypothetical protein
MGAKTYKPGQTVPTSGIYGVIHDGHAALHEVTCVTGEAFPACRECGQDVRFYRVRAVHYVKNHEHFTAAESLLNRPEKEPTAGA